MLKISKDLFTAWNDANLLYCHWKSNEHLLPGLNGETDLDVLLSRDDKEQGEVLLHTLDFLQCKSQYGARYPDVDDWIGFDKETGSLIHLHLHYRIVTGHKSMKEYSLLWTDMALRTRVLNEEYGVYTMEPNLEMVTLYTRIGLKADFLNLIRCKMGKFKFPKDTQREIDWLKQRIDKEKVKELLNTYYGDNAAAVFTIMQMDKIDSAAYQQMRRIAETTFKKCRRIKLFVRAREVRFFIYQRYLRQLVQRIKPIMSKKVPVSEKGLTIAFLGQDGAGKTTITKNLIKWWHWKMDVKYVYLGSGDNYISWKKKLSQKLPSKGVFKLFRFLLTLTDIRDVTKKAYRNILTAEKYASKGGLVVYDRYPQLDYPGICDGPKIRLRLQEKLGQGLLSKMLMYLADSEEKNIKRIVAHHPDVVIKLILPPEESIRRKPQEKLEAVKQKHEIVKSLEFKGSDVYTIDATMPFDEELIMIKNIIWQHIQK